MIDINTIITTISKELPHYNSTMFLLGGFYIYLAVLFTKNIFSKFAKVFIFILGIFFLYETLSSESILFNEMLYFSIGIFYTQHDLFIKQKPIKVENTIVTQYVSLDNSELKSAPTKENFLDGKNSPKVQKQIKCEETKKMTMDEILENISKF